MPVSRYVRPAAQAGQLSLQDRDRSLLSSIFEHRYLSAEHLHLLHFGGISLKRAQRRLRQLWVHRFVDRLFVPFVLDGRESMKAGTGAPLYMLATRGAAAVAEESGITLAEVPHTPVQNARGYATLQHHLVATDLFVALTVACRRRQDIAAVETERETSLRQRLSSLPSKDRSVPMPDGAFTLRYRGGERLTIYIEVVRALAKGGNKTILGKLQRYVDAHRGGRLRYSFGHERLRAVLLLTPTATRAEHYLDLARKLPHGARLFWFGVYTPTASMAFSPVTVLDQPWQSVEGNHSFAAPAAITPANTASSLTH